MLLRTRSVLPTVISFGVVLALGGSACSIVSEPPVPPERPKIAYVVTNTTSNFATEMGAGFRAGADLVGGIDATVVGPPKTDSAAQLRMFQELTATAKGGIAVSASGRSLFAGPMAEAAASGIPLIVSGGRPTPGAGAKLLVENDNYELGRMLADEAVKQLSPHTTGKVVLGTHTPAHPALEQRAKGMRDEFARKRPSLRVMGPFDTQRDTPANLASWQLLVVANPDAVAFLGTGDVDTLNLGNIRAETNGKWLAGGLSVEPEVLQHVKAGRLFAVVSPEHFVKGVSTAWLLAEHAKGVRRLPEGWLVTPGLAITPGNVDEIIQRQSSDQAKLAWAMPQIDRIMSQPAHFLRPLDHAS